MRCGWLMASPGLSHLVTSGTATAWNMVPLLLFIAWRKLEDATVQHAVQ